jgi:3-(3-hydroxy-phenyl)propionate hydroxylase
LFRSATIGLAKHHAFARNLINTGRMAEANAYTVSDICNTEGGWMVQNASFHFTPQDKGTLSDLLNWAAGRLLLLVFGKLKRGEIHKLSMLSISTPVSVVQVVHKDKSQAVEHVIDPHKHLRKACQASSAGWVLIRPDAYLAARGLHVDSQLIKAIAQALALQSQENK